MIEEIEEILYGLGATYDGGSEETRKEIAEEWLDAFEDTDDPIDDIGTMLNAGFWQPDVAREVYDHVIEPQYWLVDSLREFLAPAEKWWQKKDKDYDWVYALCNRDSSLERYLLKDKEE